MKTKFISSRDSYIVELCAGKQVLHIGPCDWPYMQEKIDNGVLLYARIDEVCTQQLGIDLDTTSIKKLNEMPYSNSRTIEQNMDEEFDMEFVPDIIIFGETIEHLTNVGNSLESLKRLMGENTQMIITTPNAYALGNFIAALVNKEHQHPDHSVLFSQQVLEQMCDKNDLYVQEKYFTHLDSWKSGKLNFKGRLAFFFTKHVGRVFPRLAPTLLFIVTKNEVDTR